MTAPPPYAVAPEEVLRRLGVDAARGLGAEEAAARLEEHGPNRLAEAPPVSGVRILLNQFRGFVTLLLGAAAAVSLLLGDAVDAAAIGVVLALNAAIGFTTEWRAMRSMEALRRLGSVTARVRRDGRLLEVPAEGLVPGDVLLLEGGDVVPAGARLLRASRLQADESALTGESLPVDKLPDPVPEDTPLAERASMLHRGTVLVRGSGEAVVVATGAATEVGRVSGLVAGTVERSTPLERHLDELGRRLVVATLVVVAVVTAAGVLRGKDPALMLETGIALAVAAVPEGLPIVATLALARGMLRMARRNALVKRLHAVETLGSTSVIFTDKTGTLTENRMTVTRLATAAGTADPRERAPDGLALRALEVGALCNDADLGPDRVAGVGDPMEVALLAAAAGAGLEPGSLRARWPRLGEEAFDPRVKMMATFHRAADGVRVAVKGAPEAVIAACARVAGEDGERPLGDEARAEWSARNVALAEDGLRVLAVAERVAASEGEAPYADLTLLGLVGFHDPPRADVPGAIRECRAAGIRVVMLTGDQPATARNVAVAVGLADASDAAVLHGRDLRPAAALDEAERDALLRVPVFARLTPEQKLDLVALQQARGAVVAMTGDGVNDAPALRRADIGVAMGIRGTQVAREASDVVLRDDAFPTIAHAVEEGRVIFGNIRRFVTYLLSCNVSELLVVGLATLANAPLPLLPLQLLFLNLVTDVFPALALGAGEGDRRVMRRPPRPADEPILPGREWVRILAGAAAITAATLTSFALAFTWLATDATGAVTAAFLTLALAQLWHVLNMRDRGSPLLDNEVTRNPFVWAALAVSVALLAGAVYLPGVSTVLALRPPTAAGWALVLGMSLAPLVLGQVALAVRPGRFRRPRAAR